MIARYKSLHPLIKILFWSILFLIVYTLLGFVAVPHLVKYLLREKAPVALHRSVDVTEVAFNPFNLQLQLKGVEVGSRVKGKHLFKLKNLFVDIDAVSLPKMALVISSLKVGEPQIYLQRNKEGGFNIQDLFPKKDENDKEGKSSFRFSLNNIEILKGSLIINDELKHVVHKINKINIGIPFISNIDQNVKIYVKPYFSALVNGSPFEFKGKTRPFAKDKDTIIDLRFTKIEIPHYLSYFPDVLGLRIEKGILNTDLAIHFSYKKSPTIMLSGNATINNVAISKKGQHLIQLKSLKVRMRPSHLFSKQIHFDSAITGLHLKQALTGPSKKKAGHSGSDDLFFLPQAQIATVDVDLTKNQITVANLSVKQPFLRVSIGKDGKSNLKKFMDLLLSGSGKEKKIEAESSPKNKQEGKAMVIALSSAAVENGAVDFSDLSSPKPVRLKFEKLAFRLKDFSTEKGALIPFDVKGLMNNAGVIQVKGKAILQGPKIDADVMLKNVPLPVFQGYVARYINGEIGRGHLSVRAKASFDATGDKGVFSVRGSTQVQNVMFFGRRSHKPLVKWKEIAVYGFSVDSSPLRVIVNEIVLKKVQQNIIVFKDGNTNLAGIVKETKGSDSEVPATTKDRNSGKASPKGTGKTVVKVSKVRFEACKVRIVDKSVKHVFVREFNNINGSVTALSNQPDMKAKVDITALVDNRSKMSVKGLVNPLAKPLFADLAIKVGGAGMSRFSPYSQKFLGYKIEKGKMFLDLKIKLQGKKLYVDNRLVLDQFDLGARVPSKDAINAPIKLAIALLKDTHGRIDLDIPIRGELDDPEFSYGGAVLRAIMNIFIKAATSPFSLLGAVLGSNEKLDTIAFVPGMSKLDDASLKKLDTLAKALKDRPALKVDVTGYYDPSIDKKGLLERRFMYLLKKEKFEELPNSEREKIEDINEVEIAPEEYEKYLKKAYENASFKRPRNFIGMLKKQPKEVMETMLKEHISITEGDLKILANDRARAVANYLTKTAGVANDRVFLVAPKIGLAKSKQALSGVRLSLK